MSPKNPESSSLSAIYKQFASASDQQTIKKRLLAGGLGWGEMKEVLFQEFDAQLTPGREKYQKLMQDRKALDEILHPARKSARASETRTATRPFSKSASDSRRVIKDATLPRFR